MSAGCPVSGQISIPKAAYVAGWYACSCTIIFINKFMLTDRDFKFPFTLAAMTNTVVFLTSWLLTRHPALRPKPIPFHTRVYVVGPIALLTALDIGTANWALVHLSVALHTIVRGTVPAFVLLFSLLFGLSELSWRIGGSILTVCVGIGLAAYGDIDCDAMGLTLALCSCVFSGLRWAMTQILVKAPPDSEPQGLADDLTDRQRPPIASIYHVTPACALISAAAAWLLERRELRALLASDGKAIAFVQSELLPFNAVIGVLVFVLLFCEFGLVQLTSSLTLSVLGVAKELITILIASSMRGDAITPTNLMGFLLCATGILSYRLGASKTKEDDALLPQQSKMRAGADPIGDCGDGEAASTSIRAQELESFSPIGGHRLARESRLSEGAESEKAGLLR